MGIIVFLRNQHSITSVLRAAPRMALMNGYGVQALFIFNIYDSPANGDDVQRSRCLSRERTNSIVESYLIARLELARAPGFTLLWALSSVNGGHRKFWRRKGELGTELTEFDTSNLKLHI